MKSVWHLFVLEFLVLSFLALQAWSIGEWKLYRYCVSERMMPNVCSVVFYGRQPVFRCSRVISKLMSCVDDGFVNECNETAFQVCNKVII